MIHNELILKMLRDTLEKHTGENRWGLVHCDAWLKPNAIEVGIVRMLQGAATHADAYAKQCESKIGDDGVLGEPWANILRSILSLLNGNCGRLDCGTLDGLIRRMLAAEGLGDG